jgi:hypothetical protein
LDWAAQRDDRPKTTTVVRAIAAIQVERRKRRVTFTNGLRFWTCDKQSEDDLNRILGSFYLIFSFLRKAIAF